MPTKSKHNPTKKPMVKPHGSVRECKICKVPHTINQHRHHGKDAYKTHHKRKKNYIVFCQNITLTILICAFFLSLNSNMLTSTVRPKSIKLTGRKIIYYNELRIINCKTCGTDLRHNWVLSLRNRHYKCIPCGKQCSILSDDFEIPCGRQ